jgi:hypothetical protein
MHPDCEECRRLWSEYAKATRSVESAERVRVAAREAIVQHDAAWQAPASMSADGPPLESDEEARLKIILTDCAEKERVEAGRDTLSRPPRSTPLPQYTSLVNDLESSGVDQVGVMAEWAEYRKRKRAAPATQH